MVCLLAGRTHADVQMGGSKQLVAGLQYMHTVGTNLCTFAAERAITITANDIFGYLITIPWGYRSYFSGYLNLGHQRFYRIFGQDFLNS